MVYLIVGAVVAVVWGLWYEPPWYYFSARRPIAELVLAIHEADEKGCCAADCECGGTVLDECDAAFAPWRAKVRGSAWIYLWGSHARRAGRLSRSWERGLQDTQLKTERKAAEEVAARILRKADQI